MKSLASRLAGIEKALAAQIMSTERQAELDYWVGLQCGLMELSMWGGAPDWQAGIVIGGPFNDTPLWVIQIAFGDRCNSGVGINRLRDFQSDDPARIINALLGCFAGTLPVETIEADNVINAFDRALQYRPHECDWRHGLVVGLNLIYAEVERLATTSSEVSSRIKSAQA